MGDNPSSGFIRRHRSLIEYTTVGLIAAVVISHIPIIGKLGGDLLLLISALAGAEDDDRRRSQS